MIDTAERRRSAIDFGKGERGTGMPIPSGLVGTGARSHVLNLYPGIPVVSSVFFFWRTRTIPTTVMQGRTVATSTWRTATDADEDRFQKAVQIKDS